MTQGIAGFIAGWAPSYESTMHRVEVRNVEQGGNRLLSAVPLGLQAMWAGTLMAEVAAVVSGPLYAIAQFFRIIFSPFVSFPVSILSCAAKEGFYEKSVAATAAPAVRFYAQGPEVDEPVKGTITLSVDGRDRHFILGHQIDWYVNGTIVDGGKRYWFHLLEAGEAFDDRCREVELDGEQVRIRLEFEAGEKRFVKREEGGETHYFELLNEVDVPIIGTIEVRIPFDQIDWANPVWTRHYRMNEIAEEAPGCVKITSEEQTFYYDTGDEISAPTANSRTFIIDGQERHFATAKYVRYESTGLSGFVNMISQKFINCSILPVRLSKIASDVLTFANQHLSTIIRVAIVVAGAVLLYFGHAAMAAGALLAVAYETLDHDLGVIPQKVSLFIEKWMPAISMVGLLIVGGVFTQIMAAGSLLLMIPEVHTFVHHKVAKVARQAILSIAEPLILWFISRFGDGRRPPQLDEFIERIRQYPELEEADGPLVPQRDLNAEKIREILQGNEDEYELNPASLTKNVTPLLELEESQDFPALLNLWDGIGEGWLAQYPRLLKRLADDKRFILFLKTRFPEAKRFFFEYDYNNHHLTRDQQYQIAWNDYLEDIEGWMEPFAQEQNITRQQFAVNYIRQQLQRYINKLGGNTPIEGEQRHLRDAIENTSKTLPFLLRPDILRVDLEDALVKLAVEGGDYCALAMKRASDEVLQGFTMPLILEREEQMDPHRRLENELLREFQRGRLTSIQGAFQQVMGFLRGKEQFQDTADDIHLYTAVSRAIKQGYYPMTDEERAEFTMGELLFSETLLLPFRAILKREFEMRIPDAMAGLGIDRQNIFSNRILEYLRHWVENNPHLTPAERAELLAGPLNNDQEHVADVDNHPKWHRLMLYILSIYRKKAVQPAREAAPALVPAHA